MFDLPLLQRFAADLDGFVGDLDVEVVAVAEAQAAVGVLARMGRQVDAALSLLGARVADAARDEEQARRWMAGATLESEVEAQRRLEAGRAGRRHAATGEELRAGGLSLGTARDIGAAADADPQVEGALLEAAVSGSAEEVRRKARRAERRAARESEVARERRRHAERRLSSWEDDDGGISGRFSTTTRQWAPIHGTLETFREAAFRRARHRGADDTAVIARTGAGYAMDGLELMAHVAAGGAPADLGYVDSDLPAALRHRLRQGTGANTPTGGSAPGAGTGEAALPGTDGTGRGAPTGGSATSNRGTGGGANGMGLGKLIVRVDAAALKRGWAEGDEVCDIPGVGPVTVDAVRDLLPTAFCSVVITDAHDVVSVAHIGRRPDAFQTTALQWRHPTCTSRGCRHTARIQADHDDDWAATHYTWLPGLNGACDTCHARKTHHGWAWIGTPDPDGKRTFVPPDDPRHPTHTGETPATPPRIEPKPGQTPASDRQRGTRAGHPPRRGGRSTHAPPTPGDAAAGRGDAGAGSAAGDGTDTRAGAGSAADADAAAGARTGPGTDQLTLMT